METFFSVVGLAAFLAFCYGAGLLLNKFKNAKFVRAWAPLVPVLEKAEVVEDGGGAASSWLTGTYQGHLAVACMTPERRQGESGPRFNEFSVSLRQVKGTHDWTFALRPSPEPGKSPWQMTAGSTALAQRLERAGIEAGLPGLGFPKVTYRQGTELLEYKIDITPAVVPTPELFARTLDFLVWLKQVNEQANTAG